MRARKSETGAALVETSTIIPLCIVFLIALVDLSTALNRYITLNHICYEASRVASDIPRLEEGTAGEVHSILHRKIREVINSYGTTFSKTEVTTNFEKASDRVTVTITDIYTPKFFPVGSFGSLTLRASMETPYLFLLED